MRAGLEGAGPSEDVHTKNNVGHVSRDDPVLSVAVLHDASRWPEAEHRIRADECWTWSFGGSQILMILVWSTTLVGP